jgi:hypothetical protein
MQYNPVCADLRHLGAVGESLAVAGNAGQQLSFHPRSGADVTLPNGPPVELVTGPWPKPPSPTVASGYRK